MPAQQLTLAFGPVRNNALFSTHWLEHRFPREPEAAEFRDAARDALKQMCQLWTIQKPLVEHYGDEQGLEQAFIQPILKILGWEFKYQAFLQGREPDYALFLDHASLVTAIQAGRNSPEFWTHPALVADAKAWHIVLDRPLRVGARREYPPEQIEWYLDRSRLPFGILTNGRLWRLIPREYGPQQRRFATYLETELPRILDDWLTCQDWTEQGHLLDEFLPFYLFFSPTAYREIAGRKPLIARAVEGSSEYRLGVGEGLKERTFEALRLCIEGFLTLPANGLTPADHLPLCREQSFILLYRLLFLMYAEDRRLLPYRVNRLYTNNRSLGRHRDEIAGALDRLQQGRGQDYSRESTALWMDLHDLFDLVDRGHRTYGVPAYNGGLFDAPAHPFLVEKNLSDWYLARVINQLGRAPDPNSQGDGLFRVDYHDLAIQHLGSIYEGMLELHPHHATERMIVVSRRTRGRIEERIIPATAPIPAGYEETDIGYRSGSVYLQTDKGERRATGSYYTPDHIVDHIVLQTLGPICATISEQLQTEISQAEKLQAKAGGEDRQRLTIQLEQLRRAFDDRVLRLRVLDPAIGSGHFLLSACQYLAEEIATHPYSGDESLEQGAAGQSALTFWKRRVVENCLYGVDLNELAVELAKLALWLETVSADRPLSFLDHHLRHGNSLVGAKIANLGELPGMGTLNQRVFATKVEEQLPALLQPLERIRQQPSDTADQVKVKERLYRAFDKVREPFRLVADLWCSTFAEGGGNRLTAQQYLSAIELLTNPNKFKRLADESWFQQAVASARRPDMSSFQWELEFPDVFFEGTGRHPKPGFDAIIGNPPYDVLSELETGRDLSAFRSFIDDEGAYQPSKAGKNNLYKLFICRALDLLADQGHLGFITPMPVLGDEQAAGVRRQLVRSGYFTGIEAFPQKDNPSNRIFPEAKLSTAVFTLVKGQPVDAHQRPFRSRVHPGRLIDQNSPSLTLTTDAIPLYDPSNFTIVSCSQADWDLATRIMANGRMARLQQFAEFFQGEVNETNERAKGNLTEDSRGGKLVTRGASICLYVCRPASQGTDLFIDVSKFVRGKGPETKAYHYQFSRVGLQESSPQNNFRRIIAAAVPVGTFCNHTVNYCPANKCTIDQRLIVALLNSKLADWYFRLGSTNAHVSHYQLYNLPYPVFADRPAADDGKIEKKALDALRSEDLPHVFKLLQPLLTDPPFRLPLCTALIKAVDHITTLEGERGDIARTERSALHPTAQPYQDLIDQLLFAMAGLNANEAAGLEQRLETML